MTAAVVTGALVLVIAAIWISGCSTPTQAPSKGMAPAPVPVAFPASPAATAAREGWTASAHARSFVTAADGTNNDCTRCHSPRNYVPVDSADLPKSCSSCKFTVGAPAPVDQGGWSAIGCETCHQVDGADALKATWRNAVVAEYDTGSNPYEPVGSASELCGKCHRDFKTDTYARSLGTSVHAGKWCTDCHDPHSLKADCRSCHAAVNTGKTPGHDVAHARVDCAACHDASGLKAGPAPGQAAWMALRERDARGKPGATPYQSHNLRLKVDCARCHYAGNPWKLNTVN